MIKMGKLGMTIHQTAIIDPTAKIAANVTIGPYCIIGPQVEIGEGTTLSSHVIVKGHTKIGRDNKIYQFASVGEIPQDMKYQGEETYLEIGDRNTIREFCTINRGTKQDKSMTKIGNDNLFMAYVHIAHDCIVGNHVIFSNNASLAGHVVVEDYVTFGGFSGVFQFCRIGAHGFISTNAVVIKDVPPYIKVSGYYAKPYGLNSIGLQRRGFTEEVLLELRRAYKILYRNGLTLSDAVSSLKSHFLPEVQQFVKFIEQSQTGIVR